MTSQQSTQKILQAGLEALAVGLILLPEPVTTAIGIGILARLGTNRDHRPAGVFPTLPEYSYRLFEQTTGTLSYEVLQTQEGQLPAPVPYRSTKVDKSNAGGIKGRPIPQSFIGPNDPVGLMKRPVYLSPAVTGARH